MKQTTLLFYYFIIVQMYPSNPTNQPTIHPLSIHPYVINVCVCLCAFQYRSEYLKDRLYVTHVYIMGFCVVVVVPAAAVVVVVAVDGGADVEFKVPFNVLEQRDSVVFQCRDAGVHQRD